MFNKIKNILIKLKDDTYFRNSVIIFSFSIFINIGQYLYQIYSNRNLTKNEYGLLNALLSLMLIISIISAVFRQWSTKVFGEIFSYKKYYKLKSTFIYFYKYIAGLLALIIIFFFISKNKLYDSLKTNDFNLFIFIFLIILFNYLLIPLNSFLDGLKNFFHRSLASASGVFIKLLIMAIFIITGYNLYTALLSQILGIFTTSLLFLIFVIYIIKKKKFITTKHDVNNTVLEEDSRSIMYFINIALPTFFLSIIMNIDMFIARINLSQSLSGDYATITVFGKSIYYLSIVTLPIFFVSINDIFNKKKSYNKTFLKGLGLTLLITILGVIGFIIIVKPFINMFNKKYLDSVYYLKYYTFVMILYILITFFTSFFTSVNRFKIFIILLILSLLEIFIFYFYANNINDFITIKLIFGIVMLFLLLGYFFIFHKYLYKV